MTCGVLEAPRVPRTAPTDWTASRSRAWRTAITIAVAVAILALTTAEGVRAQPGRRLPEGTITEVRIEGNSSISVEQIRAKIKSRAGSPLDQRLIEADLKSLLGTKWFSDVSPYYDDDPKAKGKGYILIFAELEQVICSGPLHGKQHTYALLDERAPAADRLDRDEALARLVRRFFTSHGLRPRLRATPGADDSTSSAPGVFARPGRSPNDPG